MGVSQPVSGFRDGASVPFLREGDTCAIPKHLGCCSMAHRIQEEEMAVREISLQNTGHFSVFSAAVYAVSYRHL